MESACVIANLLRHIPWQVDCQQHLLPFLLAQLASENSNCKLVFGRRAMPPKIHHPQRLAALHMTIRLDKNPDYRAYSHVHYDQIRRPTTVAIDSLHPCDDDVVRAKFALFDFEERRQLM